MTIMFAKVFSQILDSSLAENYQVRLVFEDFLKLADPKGIVDMTPESIARRTNVPLEIVQKGIQELERPDPTSRTPALKGKRIVRLDAHRTWGWKIVNFIKYRESATKEMLRMADKERKAEWRKRKGFSPAPLSQNTKEEDTETEQSRSRPKVSGTSLGREGFPTTEAEAVGLCANQAVPKDFVVETWNKAMSRGGCDAKGLQITSFMHYVLTEFKYERERITKNETNKGNTPVVNGRVNRNIGTYNTGDATQYLAKIERDKAERAKNVQ